MANPNDYSREERYSQSLQLTQRGKSNSWRSGSGQRITFLNICLIVLLMLIFIPRIRNPERPARRFRLGAYSIELQRSDAQLLLSIALNSDSEQISSAPDQAENPSLVGWIIQGKDGQVLHEEMDIPPLPGQRRNFQYELPADIQPKLRVLVNGQEKSVKF